jgi:hypothetical protein
MRTFALACSAVLAAAVLAQPLYGGHPRAPITPEHPRVAWTKPDANYPLQVRVFSSDRQNHIHAGIIDTVSYGSGNLLGNPAVGFDYQSDCTGGFMHNASEGEYYQGKWKKQDRKIEILVMETGSNHSEKCEMDVTLKPEPYSKDNLPPKLVTAH